MSRTIIFIILSLIAPQILFAQEEGRPAIFRDHTLTIPGSAVIMPEGVSYYRDIKLENRGNGMFQLSAAEQGKIADVTEVEVFVPAPETETVDVSVTGMKSVACVELMEPIVSRAGNEFTVILAETEPTSDVCILILEPYETSFTLDVRNLESGEYTVAVNGFERSFVL